MSALNNCHFQPRQHDRKIPVINNKKAAEKGKKSVTERKYF